MKIRANVYVDGFNLYYGCVKGTPYRWLNLSKLCNRLLPQCEVNRIRYFTALVVPPPHDPQQLARQNTYIRALQTIPGLSVHYGQFLTHLERRPLARPIPGLPRMVEVMDTKEKGSDVNLAAYLLIDGVKRDCQMAVIISNDSDLVEPIRLARMELGLEVGVLHPHRRHVKELSQVATFYRPIRERVLRDSQFSSRLTDANGTITKPSCW